MDSLVLMRGSIRNCCRHTKMVKKYHGTKWKMISILNMAERTLPRLRRSYLRAYQQRVSASTEADGPKITTDISWFPNETKIQAQEKSNRSRGLTAVIHQSEPWIRLTRLPDRTEARWILISSTPPKRREGGDDETRTSSKLPAGVSPPFFFGNTRKLKSLGFSNFSVFWVLDLVDWWFTFDLIGWFLWSCWPVNVLRLLVSVLGCNAERSFPLFLELIALVSILIMDGVE